MSNTEKNMKNIIKMANKTSNGHFDVGNKNNFKLIPLA